MDITVPVYSFSETHYLADSVVTPAYKATLFNLTVGQITGIAKKGWEYLWVRYADAEDVAPKAVVKNPVAAYVEKVYEEGNLAGLGIGT